MSATRRFIHRSEDSGRTPAIRRQRSFGRAPTQTADMANLTRENLINLSLREPAQLEGAITRGAPWRHEGVPASNHSAGASEVLRPALELTATPPRDGFLRKLTAAMRRYVVLSFLCLAGSVDCGLCRANW